MTSAESLKCKECGTKYKIRVNLLEHEKTCMGKAKRISIPKKVRTIVWKTNFDGKMTGNCYCCMDNITYDASWECGHIKSVADGGLDEVSNLKPLCVSCNRSMGTRDMHEFMKTHGFTKTDKKQDIINVRTDFLSILKPVYDKYCKLLIEMDDLHGKELTKFIINIKIPAILNESTIKHEHLDMTPICLMFNVAKIKNNEQTDLVIIDAGVKTEVQRKLLILFAEYLDRELRDDRIEEPNDKLTGIQELQLTRLLYIVTKCPKKKELVEILRNRTFIWTFKYEDLFTDLPALLRDQHTFNDMYVKDSSLYEYLHKWLTTIM